MEKDTKEAYTKWAKNYDKDKNPLVLLEHPHTQKLVNAKPEEIILDAGCGTGRHSLEFAKKGAKVIGIDFTKAMIVKAKSKNPSIEYHVADLTKKLNFQNNYFDKINCSLTLAHIDNLAFTLKEFYRILKPKGILVFSDAHPEFPFWGEKYGAKEKVSVDLGKESHFAGHKMWNYREAIKNSKFKIIEIKEIAIDKTIKNLFSEDFYKKAKGVPQIIIFKLKKK